MALLSQFENKFTPQIIRLQSISLVDDYDVFYTDLCVLLAKTHKSLLAELQMSDKDDSINKLDSKVCPIN